MKKWVSFFIIGAALTVVSLTQAPGKLIGRWAAKLPSGVLAVQYFRADGTFDVFLNNKTFVSGLYKLNQDTLSLSAPICGRGYYGSYRLTYITPDSIRWTMIQDSCPGRRSTYEQIPTANRLKAAKP